MHVSFGFIVHNKPQVALHYPLQMCGRLLGTFALLAVVSPLHPPTQLRAFYDLFYHDITH